MEIKVDKKLGVNVLYLAGKMTIGDGDVKLRKVFRDLMDSGERQFLFDMSEVPYLDSAAVGETVACAKRALEHLGIVKILLPEEGVIPRIFEVSGLERAFEIFTDEDLAVASFHR